MVPQCHRPPATAAASAGVEVGLGFGSPRVVGGQHTTTGAHQQSEPLLLQCSTSLLSDRSPLGMQSRWLLLLLRCLLLPPPLRRRQSTVCPAAAASSCYTPPC